MPDIRTSNEPHVELEAMLPVVLPASPETDSIRRLTRADLHQLNVRIAVVDDDPTGTQTVRGIPLVTDWECDSLEWAVQATDAAFAVLTNTRASPESTAQAVNGLIGERLGDIAQRLKVGLRIISRSDSTLRGHFPAEPEALAGGLAAAGIATDAVLVCPAFPEAGRITVYGTHFVAHGGYLRPASDTGYAKDGAFAYRSSRLEDWVRERAGPSATVGAVTIHDIRSGGPEVVSRSLLGCKGRVRYIVADSVNSSDLDVLARGVALAEAEGMQLIYRTGPSFVRARTGMPPAEPLSSAELAVRGGRGMLVVGSYSELTTEQLRIAREENPFEYLELDVEDYLASSAAQQAGTIARLTEQAIRGLATRDVLLATSRQVAAAARGAQNLVTIAKIGRALVDVVRNVAAGAELDWLIAKGGITSSDMAVKALEARRVTVLGQVFRGQISVWRLGSGSVAAGLCYVVFPGNVGEAHALSETIMRLKGLA